VYFIIIMFVERRHTFKIKGENCIEGTVCRSEKYEEKRSDDGSWINP
jgi:hypothetical protein